MTSYSNRIVVSALATATWCSIAACAQSQPEPTIDEDVAVDEQSIIGGQVNNVDWCVAELFIHAPGVSSGLICTCTVVGPDTCLTAAHCVDPRVIGTGKVFDILPRTNAGASTIAGTTTAFDPQWNPSNLQGGHDFGVVHMAATWPFMCAARTSFNPALPLYLVGYGADTHNDTGAGTRRSVIVPVVSSNSLLIQAGSFSAGACHGDSGGPAFQLPNGSRTSMVLVGVISFGTDAPPQVCVNSTSSARIDSALGWINQNAPCGNGVCESGIGETTLSCPLDCHVCGDGICAWGPENDSNCWGDCHCGNGVCDAGEAPWNCSNDCPETCLDGNTSSFCLVDPR